MDVHVHHEVPSNQIPTLLTVPVSVITESSPIFTTVIPQSLPSFTPSPLPIRQQSHNIGKGSCQTKQNDPLNTQVTALVDEHLHSRLGATRDEFMSYLSELITARITKQVKNQLPQILPKEVSNFAPSVIQSMVTKSLEHAILAKKSSQLKSTYEAASSLTKFELKKILIDKMDESQSYLTAPEHRECYDGLIKSYDLDKSLFSTYDKVSSVQSEDSEFEVEDSDMHKIKRRTGTTDPDWFEGKTSSTRTYSSSLLSLASLLDKLSKTFLCIDENSHASATNPIRPRISNFSKGIVLYYAELEYDYEDCYKALHQAQYDLQGIKDMVPNIWSPVKVSYDKYALWGISHWRQERKTFYGYVRGLESSHDVYSIKHILVVTRAEVMKKHGYGYLREIGVRRADNDLYTFKEGDFPPISWAMMFLTLL
ncbi:hypothetical protein Tco_1148944 [Tanacetum coccineum]